MFESNFYLKRNFYRLAMEFFALADDKLSAIVKRSGPVHQGNK